MPSFGEKLKREREKRAVTLEQISISTKIGTRMLQALEEDKFSQLPGGIFNKGFVRAYARCVGLDEDQTVADYLEASGETAPTRPDAPAEPLRILPEAPPDRSSRDLPWGLFAAVLLIVALILSVWSYRKREHRPAPPSTSSTLDGTQPTSAAAVSPESRQTPSIHPAVNVAQAVAPAKAAAPPSTAPAKAVPPATSSASTAPSPLPAQPGEFTVFIQAREDSWVSITADGKVLLSDTLPSGEQRSVHGRNLIVIRAGNTGALDFSFNGNKLASQGDYGEVKTLTFSAAGLIPNRPTPPPSQ